MERMIYRDRYEKSACPFSQEAGKTTKLNHISDTERSQSFVTLKTMY